MRSGEKLSMRKNRPVRQGAERSDPENSQVSSVYLAALPRAFSTGYLAAF